MKSDSEIERDVRDEGSAGAAAGKGISMSDFPPINDELRPRAKLKKHSDGPATDEEIEANSRRIGEKWGAATHIPMAAPEPTPAPTPAPWA